ncbi:hypothetical protein [Roseateles sp. P5_E7]
MNAPLSRTEIEADIDARIWLAEEQLVAREARLRRGMTALGRQVHEATRPARLLQPALLTAAVAVIVLAWPSRKASPVRATQQQPGTAAAAVARPALFVLLAGIPWTRLLSHAWPLLPGRWRERLNPATAASMLTFGLPLLEGWLTRRRHDEPAGPR